MGARRIDVELALRGKDEGASSTVEKLGKHLRMLKKEANESGELAIEEAVRNPLEGLLKLVGGGKLALGALIAEQAGERLNSFTEKIVESRKELEEEKITAGEMVDKIAAGIPLLGPFWEAGRNIHEMLTGEKQDIELINEEAERTREFFDAWSEAAISAKEAIKDVYAELKKRHDVAQLSDQNPLVQQRKGLQDDIEELRRKQEARSHEQSIEFGLGGGDAVDKLKKARAELEKLKDQTKNISEGPEEIKEELKHLKELQKAQQTDYSFVQGDLHPTSINAAEIDRLKGLLDNFEKQDKLKKKIAEIEGGAVTAAGAKDKQDLEDKRKALEEINRQYQILIGRTNEAAKQGAEKAQAAAARAELQAAGKGFEAQIQAIRDQAQQDQEAVLRGARERIQDLKLKPDSAEARTLMSDAQAQAKAIADKARADEVQAKKQQYLQEQGLASDVRQKELQAHGDLLGAQLEQIRENYAARIAMAKTQAEKEALARSQALDEADARRQAKIDQREKAYERKRQIRAVMIGELDEKAAVSQANRKAAIKAHIEAEAADTIHDLQKTLEDKTASPEEKRRAREAIQRVKADAKRRERYVDDNPVQENRRGVRATLLNGRFHDLAGQYEAGAEPGLAAAKKTADNTGHLSGIEKGISTMIGIFRNGIAVKGRSLTP